MDKVLILSCSTGQGHNSCAQALSEFFQDRGVECEIHDSLEFVSKSFARFVSWGHSFMYRHIPGLFHWGYGLTEDHPGMLHKDSFIYKALARGAGRMYNKIISGGFDTVICVHMFSAMVLTQLLKQYKLEARTAFVATDYTLCPGTDSCGVQYFFIPSETLLPDYERCMKPGQRVVAAGIPVRAAFWDGLEREKAREKLNISMGSKHLLMMCGSMGCGPMVKLLHHITEDFPRDLEVTVVCGTNKRLQKYLTRAYAEYDRVHIVGYTHDIPLFMDSADLYLTKPGGISVTEAAAKGLPMAFIDAVAGCERYNMDFFESLGAAVADRSAERLAKTCLRLLYDPSELKRMRQALLEYRQPNGSELIYYELQDKK